MMQKHPESWLRPRHMGTHLRVLSESYLMNTNMTGFWWFSKNLGILVLWTKVALALEGLTPLMLGLFRPMHKKANIYKNHLNPVMLVFIWKLLRILSDMYPCARVSVSSLCFCQHVKLTKLAISKRVKWDNDYVCLKRYSERMKLASLDAYMPMKNETTNLISILDEENIRHSCFY